MAIALEFIDFVVPITLIREKYLAGWPQCVKDYEVLIGGCAWFDEHLLRDGAMNPDDIESLIDEWTGFGFEPTVVVDVQRVWKDCCAVESMLGGTALPSDWLELADDGATRS